MRTRSARTVRHTKATKCTEFCDAVLYADVDERQVAAFHDDPASLNNCFAAFHRHTIQMSLRVFSDERKPATIVRVAVEDGAAGHVHNAILELDSAACARSVKAAGFALGDHGVDEREGGKEPERPPCPMPQCKK